MEDGVYTLDVIGRTGEGITLFADIGKLNLFKKSRFRRYPFARVLGVNIFGYSANIEGYIFGNKNVIEIEWRGTNHLLEGYRRQLGGWNFLRVKNIQRYMHDLETQCVDCRGFRGEASTQSNEQVSSMKLEVYHFKDR